jgi:hypothetical protein
MPGLILQSDLVKLVVLCGLLTMLEHYLPWKAILGVELPKLIAYVLGILAVFVPLTLLFVEYPMVTGWRAALALWVAATGAGLGTVLCYVLDDWLVKRKLAIIHRKEAAMVRRSLDQGEGE